MKMNIKSLIPLLGDDELHALVEKMAQAPDLAYEGVTPNEIAPFLEEEDVDILVAALVKAHMPIKSVLPFASSSGIALAFKGDDGQTPSKDFLSAIPFLDEEDADSIVIERLKKGSLESIASFAPFMSDEGIETAFFLLLDKGNYAEADSLMSLLDEDTFTKLVDKAIEGKYPDYDFSKAYPLMDEDDVKRLFLYALKRK